MAAIQQRGKSIRILFRFRGKQRCLRLGTIDLVQAESHLAEVEELLELLNKRRLTLPPEIDIVTFLEHDGKVPADIPITPATTHDLTLGELQRSYF
ncbi:MAG: hypothetical protein ACFCD0_29745 [Gemmataceae bacterium]